MNVILIISLVNTENWDILFLHLVSGCHALLIFNNLPVNLQLNKACSWNKINKCREEMGQPATLTLTKQKEAVDRGVILEQREGALFSFDNKKIKKTCLWCEWMQMNHTVSEVRLK